MKGQTQALTTVLITTIIVGAIAAGYTWGTPLLEKRESQASLNNLERDVVRLYSAMNNVADSGKGSARSIDLEIDSGGVNIAEDEDYLEIRTNSPNSPYPDGVWKLLRGSSMQNLSIGTGLYGIKGNDAPGVVAVKSQGSSIVYRIEYRNLKGSSNLEKIDIRSVGSRRANGDVEIVVRNTGLETDSDYRSGGQTFNRRRTVLEVDIK